MTRPEEGEERGLPVEPPGEGARATEDREPDAGPREVVAGVVLVAVMLVGFVYSYYQGLQTGRENGAAEALEGVPNWAPALADGKLAGGVRLREGQRFEIRITGPGDEVQEDLIAASPGDRVAVVVARGAAAAR